MSADADGQSLPQERLKRLAELSEDEFERLIESPRRGIITRRTLIAAMISAGIGWGTIQNVLAQADENDSVGDVGTPSNPVDVFADGVDANSVSVNSLSISDWRNTADFVIYNKNGSVVAFNTETKTEEHSGSDISTPLSESINSLKDGSGEAQGEIYITGGDYEYSSSASLNDAGGITIRGAGMRATEINQADGSDDSLFTFSKSSQQVFFRLQDFTASGNKSNNSTGMLLNNSGEMADLQVVRVFAKGFPDNGIQTSNAWGWKLNHFVSEFNGGDGFFCSSQANRGLSMWGCKLNRNDGWGLRDNSTGESQYVGCEFGSNVDEGAYIGGSAVQMVGCSVYNNSYDTSGSNDGILIAGSDATLTGMYVDGQSQQRYGIHFNEQSSDCRLGVLRSINNTSDNVVDNGTNNQRVSLTTI